MACGSAAAQELSVTLHDTPNDAAPKRTDPGADTPFDPDAHRLIDLREMTTSRWTPFDARVDLFTGEPAFDGEFLRLDLVVDGLVNPPGNPDPFAFDPFRFGDHPIYGFVEIDMDDDVWTGGELDAPQYRYLGNAVRFGGRTLRPRFGNRAAQDGSAFDGQFMTPPFVERHGEEFHLALLGWQFEQGDIEEMIGNGDATFDPGETWNIRGPFLHRAHGYEPFSFVEGGQYPGEYAPFCDLQFKHDAQEDVTYLSLVIPLTNVGAGMMLGQYPQPSNQDPTDHASILEGLEDLEFSAAYLELFPTGMAEEDIIIDWAGKNPSDYLDITTWSITALLGTSYTQPDPAGIFYVWTDIYPNVVRGDVDGSGVWNGHDRQLISDYVFRNDGIDGMLDGVVAILDFATGFDVFDVNHDGVVDHRDLTPVFRDGDSDRDGDVDLVDVANFQHCITRLGAGGPRCTAMDLTGDERVNQSDVGAFVGSLTGPGSD